jgi:quercetin dioxygenase-like cupin family protein
VKAGDIIIIPAGVPHGWAEIPEHVDYLSFRPSARVLEAGYVNPALKK